MVKTLAQINRQIDKLQRQADALKKQEVSGVISRIKGAIDHLNSLGVEVVEGPGRRPGARGEGTSVYFRDPDGSLLELISYG